MKDLKKLSRDEMKNVLGGNKIPPPSDCPGGTIFAICDYTGGLAYCVTAPLPGTCHAL